MRTHEKVCVRVTWHYDVTAGNKISWVIVEQNVFTENEGIDSAENVVEITAAVYITEPGIGVVVLVASAVEVIAVSEIVVAVVVSVFKVCSVVVVNYNSLLKLAKIC